MANTSSTIQIIFDGAVRGLRAAAAEADRAISAVESRLERFSATGDRLNRTSAAILKGFVGLGAAASSVQGLVAVVGGLASVTAQLAPAALAIPGIVLGIGVAYGTAKLALAGFSDAVKGNAEALAKFGVQGQAAVRAVQGLEAGFTKMRKAVSEAFFAGLAPQIKQVGKSLLDLGTKELPAVATGFNGMAKAALVAMDTPVFKNDLTEIIQNTGAALGNMRNTLANVLSGFVGLGAVGSSYLPRIGKAIDDVAAKFKRWVDEGVESGSIKRMIDNAIQGFKDIGAILVNLANGARSFWRAFSEGLGGSGNTLATIRDTTAALSAFLASTEAQAAFRALGETVRIVGDAFRAVLLAALQELGPILVAIAPFVQEVARQIGDFLVAAIRTVGPMLRELATFLSENRAIIAPLAPLVLVLAGAFRGLSAAVAAFRSLQALVTGLRAIATAIRGINPATLARIAAVLRRFIFPALAFAALADLAKHIDEVNLAAAGGDETKLTGFADTLHNITGAIDQIKQALAGNPGPLIQDFSEDVEKLKLALFSKPAGGGEVEGSLSRTIGDLVTRWTTDFLLFKTKADEFVTYVQNIPTRLSEGGASLDTFVQDKFTTPLINGFTNLRTQFDLKVIEIETEIQNFFNNPAGAGFDVGAAVGQLIIDFLNGFTTFATDTRVKLGETSTQITEWITVDVPAAFATFTTTLQTKATEAWDAFKLETETKINEVTTFVTDLPNKIDTALAELPGILQAKAKAAWDFFFGETQTGTDNSVTESGKLPGETGTSLANLPQLLLNKAKESWQRWLDGQIEKARVIIDDARALPGKVVDAIGDLGRTLVAKGESLIQGFIDGIRSKIPGIEAAARAAAAAASAFFPGSPAKKGPLSGRGYVLLRGQRMARDFALGIGQGAPLVSAAADRLAGMVDRPLSIQGAFDAAREAQQRDQAAARLQLGDTLNRVALAREQEPPVVNVMLSRAQFEELARIEIQRTNRETARRVVVGAGQSF